MASIVDYYAIIKKQKQQLLKTAFITITTKFVSVFWICHNKWKLWKYSILIILLKAITFQEFSARSVLGKPFSKQVSSTELIDLLSE